MKSLVAFSQSCDEGAFSKSVKALLVLGPQSDFFPVCAMNLTFAKYLGNDHAECQLNVVFAEEEAMAHNELDLQSEQ